MQHKIRSAKRAARSELSVSRGEWQRQQYAQSDILSLEGLQDSVPRIHISVSAYNCGAAAVALVAVPKQQLLCVRRGEAARQQDM